LRSSIFLDLVGGELSHAGFYGRAGESHDHQGHEGTRSKGKISLVELRVLGG
jgi:hypothetical protein